MKKNLSIVVPLHAGTLKEFLVVKKGNTKISNKFG